MKRTGIGPALLVSLIVLGSPGFAQIITPITILDFEDGQLPSSHNWQKIIFNGIDNAIHQVMTEGAGSNTNNYLRMVGNDQFGWFFDLDGIVSLADDWILSADLRPNAGDRAIRRLGVGNSGALIGFGGAWMNLRIEMNHSANLLSFFLDNVPSGTSVPSDDLLSFIPSSNAIMFHFGNLHSTNQVLEVDNILFAVVSQDPVVLYANQDSFLRGGNKNRNEGANPRLRIQATGNNRAVVDFDLTGIDTSSVTQATLILTIAENANNWGPNNDRTVDAHPLLVDFAEGDGQNAGVPASISTRGTGQGVTWNCDIDGDISNQQPNCDPEWDGGSFGPATAPSVIHTNGLLGAVEWDVTSDVLAGSTGWIIKKTNEGQTGKVFYYSREGAAELGDPTLTPQLILGFQ